MKAQPAPAAIAGDRRPLDQLVRVLLDQLAVLERARLGLVGVAAKELVHVAPGQEGRLLAHREAGAAATAQAGALERGQQLLRLDLLHRTLQRAVAAEPRDRSRSRPARARRCGGTASASRPNHCPPAAPLPLEHLALACGSGPLDLLPRPRRRGPLHLVQPRRRGGRGPAPGRWRPSAWRAPCRAAPRRPREAARPPPGRRRGRAARSSARRSTPSAPGRRPPCTRIPSRTPPRPASWRRRAQRRSGRLRRPRRRRRSDRPRPAASRRCCGRPAPGGARPGWCGRGRRRWRATRGRRASPPSRPRPGGCPPAGTSRSGAAPPTGPEAPPSESRGSATSPSPPAPGADPGPRPRAAPGPARRPRGASTRSGAAAPRRTSRPSLSAPESIRRHPPLRVRVRARDDVAASRRVSLPPAGARTAGPGASSQLQRLAPVLHRSIPPRIGSSIARFWIRSAR